MDKELKLQFLKTTTTLMTAAFGMVAALAWNSAISEFIKDAIGTSDSGIMALLAYAVVVTIFAVFATVVIARASSRAQDAMDRDGMIAGEKRKDAWIREWEEEREKEEFKKKWEAGEV